MLNKNLTYNMMIQPINITYYTQENEQNITGLHASTHLSPTEDYKHSSNYDLICHIIKSLCNQIKENNITLPITLNVNDENLLNSAFIKFCINHIKELNLHLSFCLSEDISRSSLEIIVRHLKLLQEHKISLSLEISNYNYQHLSLVLEVNFDRVAFSKKITENIANDFVKFKYLRFLNGIMLSKNVKDIVFIDVNNKVEEDLIRLINPDSSFQSNLNMSISSLKKIHPESLYFNKNKSKLIDKDRDIEWLVYNLIISTYDKSWNKKIKSQTFDNGIYNNNPKNTMKNFSAIYQQEHLRYTQVPLANIINNSDKMVVIRNSNGVVLFENKKHEDFFGRSLVGLSKDDVIAQCPDYKLCILDDVLLLNSKEMFSVKKEIVNNDTYFTIRQKVSFNKDIYILVTVYEESKGIFISKDPLTGCMNRDMLKTINNNKFYNNKVIAFIDLNGFKKINDNLGHDIGDSVLTDFSEILKRNLRLENEEDTIIRYGGDEFVILFNSFNKKQVDIKLKSLNNLVTQYFFNKFIALSFSYGLSINKNNDLDITINKADKLMYLAKQKSRETLTNT